MNIYGSTVPEELPDKADVLRSFNDLIRYGKNPNDPEERLSYIAINIADQFIYVAGDLHNRLTVRNRGNHYGISGLDTVSGLSRVDGKTSFDRHGLDKIWMSKAIMDVVIDEMTLLAEQRDVPVDEKLRIAARMLAVAVANSQTISDGNTRIARAIHDYVLLGPDEFSVNPIFDETRTFLPSFNQEELILKQNMYRLIGRGALNTSFEPVGGVYVDRAYENIFKKYKRITQKIGYADDRDRYPEAVLNVLCQRDYGPAALTVADQIGDYGYDLDSKEFQDHLVAVDKELLTLRIMSQVAAASSGYFVSVVDSRSKYKSRAIKKVPWESYIPKRKTLTPSL